MALYPQTTCFYKAVINRLPTLATEEYEVLFEDPSYADGYSPPLMVAQRYVIQIKDVSKKKWGKEEEGRKEGQQDAEQREGEVWWVCENWGKEKEEEYKGRTNSSIPDGLYKAVWHKLLHLIWSERHRTVKAKAPPHPLLPLAGKKEIEGLEVFDIKNTNKKLNGKKKKRQKVRLEKIREWSEEYYQKE